MSSHDDTILPADDPADPRRDVTIVGAAAADRVAAERCAARYWDERAKGRDVTVDELLADADDELDRDTLRSSVMALIGSGSGARPTDRTAARPRRPGEAEDAEPDSLPAIEGYTLVRCLGRGGMGAVYEGFQQSTGRRVAVKFMLDAVSASDSARKRFEREVEVVARLQHPGIVSIIDSGVRRGRYFYVMEYVEGRPLDSAIERGRADVRRTLDIVVHICDAVEAAHQRGILHRDLKPGNIVIDDADQPHLLDFGLAKTFDPDLDNGGNGGDGGEHGRMGLTVSGPGQLLGTVAYMSPEQAQGRHDETSVRTDVYALGAIAYESLTGRLPCPAQGSLHDVLARIINEDPPAASSLRKGLSRDLDAVLARALEKSPERRYATVGELTAELRRVIAGEPVLARRIGTIGRGWRWVGRNRAVSATAAVALLTLVTVSSALIAGIVRESRIAAFERDIAKENFDRLRSILESADPERSPGGATVIQLLDAASRALDESPPERALAEVQIREVLGGVYRKLGEYGKAFEHQEKALLVRERLSEGRDDPMLADAMHNLAATLWWDGDYVQAERHYTRSLQMRRRLFSGDHPAVGASLTHLAACRLRLGKLDDAREMYEEALAMRRRLYGAEHEEVAQALNNLAKALLEADHFRRAEALHREALEMITRLRGGSFVGTAAASQNLAECLLRRSVAEALVGDSRVALEVAQQAADAFERALEIRASTFPAGHHLIAASLNGLARAALHLGELERADRLASESLDMIRRTRRDDHPDVAAVLETVGSVRLASGDAAAAAAALEEALAIAVAVRPRADLQVAQIRSELGAALALLSAAGALERWAEAASLLSASHASMRELRGEGAVDTVVAARRLVRFHAGRGEHDVATRYLESAQLASIDDAPGTGTPR